MYADPIRSSRTLAAVLWIRIRIRMFFGLLVLDPLVSGLDPDPNPSIIKQKQQENLDSYGFVTFL